MTRARRLRDLAAAISAGLAAATPGGERVRGVEMEIALDVYRKLRRAWWGLSARERGRAGLRWAQRVVAEGIADKAWRTVRKRRRAAIEAREKGMSVEEKRRRARNRRKAGRA